MKKITCLMAVLFATLWSVVSAQDYSVNYTGTKSERKMTSITLISSNNGTQSVSLPGTNLYDDKTSTTFTVTAGEQLTAQFGYTDGWMHGYVYIDWDHDGFTAGIASDGYTPIEDLMTYSFYAGSDTGNSDASGKNSVGATITGDARSVVNPPVFTCPNKPGTYRMRYKLDWSNINPAGSQNAKGSGGMGTLKENNGQIVDVTLVVEALTNSADVTYIYTHDGNEIYRSTQTLNVGASMPDYLTPPSYVNLITPTDIPTTVPDGGGTYTIATTTKSDSPFKFSSSLNDPQWVTMKVLYSKNLPGTPSEGAVNYDAANWITNANPYVGITKDASTAENYANYMWAFVGDWYHGYKIYSYADKAKMWGYGKDGFITSNNIADRAIQLYDSEVNENLRTWQIVKWQGTDGADNYAEETYSLVLVNTDHPNFYAGEHLAANQYKLGTWMTSTNGNTAAHNRIAIADPLPIYTAYAQTVLAEAGKVGYPKTTSGGATQLETALTSATNFSELYGYVENFRSESDVVLPTDGKAYILKAHFTGSDKYVALGSEALTTSDTEGATFICHQLDNGKFVFVNNNGTFFNKVGNFTAYSDWTEFTLLHSGGEPAQAYGTFGMYFDSDYKYLTVNGTSFQQGYEGIAETSTTAFYLEETTYANNPAMTTAQGIDPEKKIATFSAPFAFTLPAGIDAYIVKQTKTDGTASLTKLASEGEVVAANTGVILLGTTDEANVLMIPATTTGVNEAESMLGNTAGAPKDIVTDGNNYILAMNGDGNIIFSKALEGANGNNQLAMNKAYLTVPGGSVNQFKINFGDTTTAIEAIATESNKNEVVYDLSGRRIATPSHRGIYISNGKKFMVK